MIAPRCLRAVGTEELRPSLAIVNVTLNATVNVMYINDSSRDLHRIGYSMNTSKHVLLRTFLLNLSESVKELVHVRTVSGCHTSTFK